MRQESIKAIQAKQEAKEQAIREQEQQAQERRRLHQEKKRETRKKAIAAEAARKKKSEKRIEIKANTEQPRKDSKMRQMAHALFEDVPLSMPYPPISNESMKSLTCSSKFEWRSTQGLSNSISHDSTATHKTFPLKVLSASSYYDWKKKRQSNIRRSKSLPRGTAI